MGTAGGTEFDGELDGIVRRLEPLLGVAAGEPVPLSGGITNRNYRLALGVREYVVRLPGKDTSRLGISRDAERIASEAAAALGIAPALAAQLPDCLVTEFIQAQELPQEALRAKPEQVARALRSFHDAGPLLPCEFDVPRLFGEYAATVRERGGVLPEQYAATQEALTRIADALPSEPLVPCHNDLLNGNLLLTADGSVLIVDWEYAGMGDRYFDLGNLSVNNGFDDEDDERLLAAYFAGAPTAAQRSHLALMRIVSDAREAAWGVAQIVLSELDFDFAGYAERHFARLGAALADPRLEEWLDGASA
jgi:thiamine kinase-like enzyme